MVCATVAEAKATEAERQNFLDTSQYSMNGVLRYEFIFGEGYISSGGGDTTTEILEMLKLPQGGRAIDIGCGIGGGTLALAEKCKLGNVLGIDLSTNVVSIANSRYNNHPQLEFKVADAVTMDLPEKSLDLVYSRDALIHFPTDHKRTLFENSFKWLKSGGQILITDYCAAPQDEWDEEFTAYIKQREYSLTSVEHYASLLKDAGFVITMAKDHTDRWLQCLSDELERLETHRQMFLKHFTSKDLDDLSDGWKRKIIRATKGLQRWGLFIAYKP